MSPLEQLNPMRRYPARESVEAHEDGLPSRLDIVSRGLHITDSAVATATLLMSRGARTVGVQGTTPTPPDGPESPTPDDEHDFRDVVRQHTAEGNLTLAIDLLSREGGTDAVTDPSEIPAVLTDGDPGLHVADLQATIIQHSLSGETDLTRVLKTGVRFGSGITWCAATQISELKATMPSYAPPPLVAVPDIRGTVLGVYPDDPNDGATGNETRWWRRSREGVPPFRSRSTSTRSTPSATTLASGTTRSRPSSPGTTCSPGSPGTWQATEPLRPRL